jgi:antitoxin VapB
MRQEGSLALYIRSERVDRLARELAERTGESITTAVGKALEERLSHVKPQQPSRAVLERNRAALDHLWKAREACLTHGVVAPTKDEIEEMVGMEY